MYILLLCDFLDFERYSFAVFFILFFPKKTPFDQKDLIDDLIHTGIHRIFNWFYV